MIIGDDGIVNQALDAKETTEEEAKKSEESRNSLMNEMLETNQLRDARPGLKVGDYIDYTPDKATPYTALTLANTGSGFNSRSIAQESLKWQILKIYTDGSIDLMGTPIRSDFYFKGAIGYNNGVYLMNDLCEKLYSRGSIKARSVNIEDIEKCLTDKGKEIKNNYVSSGGCKVGEVKQYTVNDFYYPNLFAKENGSGINTYTVRTDGIGMSKNTSNDFTVPTIETYSKADMGTAKHSYWDLNTTTYNTINSTNFGDAAKVISSDTYYYVASRFVNCESNYVAFGMFAAIQDISHVSQFYSNNVENYDYGSIRPVVSLGPDVQITASSTASNSSGTPHSITQY